MSNDQSGPTGDGEEGVEAAEKAATESPVAQMEPPALPPVSDSAPELDASEMLVSESAPELDASAQIISESAPELDAAVRPVSDSAPELDAADMVLSDSALEMDAAVRVVAEAAASDAAELTTGDLQALTAPASDSAPEIDVADAEEIAPPKLPGMPRPPMPMPAPPKPRAAVSFPTLEATIVAARAQAETAKPEQRAALYEAEMEALGPQSRSRQAVYAHELGELAAERGDEGGAMKAWARALQADPSLRPNLWAIRRVFERRQMWPNVLRLIEAELRLATQPAERAELHVERGVVLEDRLDDVEGAEAAFKAAIDADPRSLRARMALERRYLETNADPALVRENLAGLAGATDDPSRRAALFVDLARLEDDAGDEGAAKQVLDDALAVELGDETRGRAFAGSGHPASIDELERLALRKNRPDWRAEVLRHRLALLGLDTVPRPPTTTQESERIARGVVLQLRLGALAEETGEHEAAIAAYEVAVQLAVDDPVSQPLASIELMGALRAAGQHGRAGVLALAFAREAPPKLRAALLLDAVDLLDEATDAEPATVAARDEARVEAEAAGLGPALAARARRVAELRGDDEALVRLALTEADRAHAAGELAQEGAQLLRAATLLGERLGRGDEAIALHERALAALPNGAAWDDHADALEWRLLRDGSIDAAVVLVARRIERTEAAVERAALRVRRAGLLADRVNDPAGAAEELRLALEALPDELRLRYLRVGLLRQANAPGDAAVELSHIVARTESDERKALLELERGALLAWHANDLVGGEAALRESLRLAPGSGRATAALEELFERQRGGTAVAAPAELPEAERADTLVAALRSQIEGELDPTRVLITLSRLAELHERRRDYAAARETYMTMLDRSSDATEQGVALRGLARAQVALGDADALFETLEREYELLDEAARPLQRARIAFEKERRGRADAAEPDHAAILESDAPADVRAAAQLGLLRAALRSGEAADRATALEAILPLVDPELAGTRSSLDVELAEALRQAGRFDDAAAASARARAATPELRSAQLSQLVTAGARDDVRGVAAGMIDIANGLEIAPRGELLRRSALLAWSVGDVEDARARIEAAAAVHTDPATQVMLAEISNGVSALQARLAVAEGASRVPWLLALSEAQAAQGELAASSHTLDELLELSPRSLLGLDLDRRVRKAAGDRRGYARRTLALGELLSDVEHAAKLLTEAGQAFEALGELAAAAYSYREALERTPLDGTAYSRARAMLLAAVDGDDDGRSLFAKGALVELYAHRLEYVVDAEERLATFRDRAELTASDGDRAQAERDLQAALELDPNDARSLAALLRLCAEDRTRLRDVRELASRLDRAQLDPASRRDVLLRIADAEQRGGGDPERAIAALQEAVDIDADTPTLRTLGVLLRERRYWQRAIDVRKQMVSSLPSEQAARVELEIADLWATGVKDIGAARDAALRAVFLDPLSGDGVAALVRYEAPPSVGLRAVLEPAAEAARRLLDDPSRRGVAVQHLRAVAALLADTELAPITTQLAALTEGRTLEPRPLHALPPRAITQLARDVARAPEVDGVLRELLVAIGETATRLHPIDARFGKLSRPSSKQRTELMELDALAKTFTILELPVELGDGAAIAADDARVAIGRELVPLLRQPAGRLRAARVLWLFAEGLGVIDRVDDAALIGLVAGCLGVCKQPWPDSLAACKPSAQVMEERTRAVDKALSRKERKTLLALVPSLPKLGDPRLFRAAVLGSALRVGLLVTGDLAAVAAEVGVDRTVELGRFAVSSAFVAARHRWLGEGA